jgi:hypothetical protein
VPYAKPLKTARAKYGSAEPGIGAKEVFHVAKKSETGRIKLPGGTTANERAKLRAPMPRINSLQRHSADLDTVSTGTHTPGPWTIQGGQTIAGIRPDDSGLPLMVASVVVPIHFSGEFGRHVDMNVMHANARLIAAAPDLLDALTMALPYVECAETDPAYKNDAVKRVTAQICAAIAKAEGRQ